MADYTLKHTGSEIDAAIDTVKTGKMPNPQPLTINGTSYDGSKAIALTISGDDSSNRVYILPSTTLTEDEMQLGSVWFLNDFVLTEGATYIVSYNSTDYECVCKSYDYSGDGSDSLLYIGNGRVYEGVDTGEPFRINTYPEGGQPFITVTDGATEFTVAISRYQSEPRLPDTTGVTDTRLCAWNGSEWVLMNITVLKALLGIS